ncbi:MAG TPA: ATP-binding cassette domain-containing protein [bacterium]|nr:ATP-binding cassette domain-containing protein [bacterium]
MPANLIEAKNLSKAYGDFKAVDGVDFAVRRGECFGFLGPNGAGKSTLMKMIYCFSPRSAGELTVLGLNPDRQAAALKNRLGVVAQSDNLDDEISVRENLEIYSGYFGLPKKQAAQKIEELLHFMSLTEKAAARIRELSGGLKRRLVIARALLNDPELLILDEPTTGLDPQVRHLIWVKLRELKKRGVTLLLTTHYMEEAQQLCDRLLVMDKGRVLAQGKPRDLMARHLPPYVMELPASRRLAATPPGVKVDRYQDRVFLYAKSPAQLHRLAGKLKGHFSIRPVGLEDLFLKLTGRDLHESE